MPTKSYAEHVDDAAQYLANQNKFLEESNSYYEATYRVQSIGISTPSKMRCLRASIGWGRMYIDAIEERLDLEDFRLADNDEMMKRLRQWWQSNNLDELSSMAHIDALVYGRSYVTVSAPGPDDLDQDTPIICVESPMNMWADIDPRTNQVTRAVRLYANPLNLSEKWATLYLPNETVYLKSVSDRWVVDRQRPKVVHNLGAVPVVAIINRERLAERHGASEITEELRSFIDAASRTMMNMQAAAELMAVPQRILFGVEADQLAPNGTPEEVFSAYMAQILAIGSAEGRAEQFQAAELMNFVNVLQELAKHVASYTGLPPQYLSFSSDNPASAEAIKSSESRLVKKCERKARLFGGSWEQVMRLAVKIMDGSVPTEMSRLQSVWRDPSTPTYAAKADGVVKLYNAGTGVIPKHRARVDMGYTDEEIEQMAEWDKEDKDELYKLADAVSARRAATGEGPGGDNPNQQSRTPAPAGAE